MSLIQPTLILCRACQKPLEIHAHGLCNKCHTKQWREANPEAAKAIAKRSREKRREKEAAAHREYYQKHRERLLERQRIRDLLRADERRNYNREYQRKNKGRLDDYYRAWRLAAKYGLSMKDYEERITKQNGVCAICGREQVPLHVDHCHATGNVRGLLCVKCNSGLAYLDNANWVKKARTYLRKPPKP